MAQESTFTPEIRSDANAYGLLQITPPTGRMLARQLGLRYTTSMLTQAETNVRMGTKYFKDLIEKFGGVHYALAGYNAGPHRVVTWRREARPALIRTNSSTTFRSPRRRRYVKRILGTAEDYRRLYGSGILDVRPVWLPRLRPCSSRQRRQPAAKPAAPRAAVANGSIASR